MYTAPFRYLRPKTLAEAQALFRDSSDARYIAGGQTLIPTMKQRLAAPSELIDIGRIASLAFIRREGPTLVIGAGTPHADVAASAEVRGAIPALASLAGQIGDPAVRHRGTLGGSIANNDPAADYPAGVVGLGATVRTTDRSIAADEFFTGMFETALEPGEIVTEITFPVPRRAGYAKFPNPASRYATVGVFVAAFANHVRLASSVSPRWKRRWPRISRPKPSRISRHRPTDSMPISSPRRNIAPISWESWPSAQ